MTLDDNFPFSVDLNTDETRAMVFLNKPLAGKLTQYRLKVTGTGFDAEGNGPANFKELCRVYRKK